MRIEHLMNREVLTLSKERTLRDAWELMRMHRIRQIPVVEDSTLIGIVTDRDVRRALPSLFHGRNMDEFDRVLDSTTVERFMTKEPFTIKPTDSLRSALDLMLDHKVGGLPVVDDTKLVGIVTETDFLRLLRDRLLDDAD